MARPLLPTLALAATLAVAHAEYRVALLIDNSPDKDLTAIEAGLEKYDFICETVENLSGKDLERKVSGWASTTPTNSTALIYFIGPMQEKDGEPAFAATDGKSTNPVGKLLTEVANRGGSRHQLIVADTSEKIPWKGEFPDDSLFAYADLSVLAKLNGNETDLVASLASVVEDTKSTLAPGTTVSGPGSVAISPSDKFIPGSKAGDEWVNGRGMIFVWCPPGSYTAGSPEVTPGRFADEEPREVTIKEGFWIGKYELTVVQNLRDRNPRSVGQEKNQPKVDMHWDDGSRMAEKMMTEAEREAGRLPDSWQYHLPSADQWEYAARAGTKGLFYFGDDASDLPQHANFADKSFYDTGAVISNYAHRTWDDGYAGVAPVGRFEPNPWGLYDVYGNVSEWCRDHAVVGGGWVTVAENCRSAYRDSRSARNNQTFLGYRLVIQPNLPEKPKEEKKKK